jgi:pyruvate carboxylase subunit B
VKYRVTVDGTTFAVELEAERLAVDGRTCDAQLAPVDGTPLLHLLLDGASWTVAVDVEGADGAPWILGAGGERLSVEVIDEGSHGRGGVVARPLAPAGETTVLAPMPGLVVRIEVAEGQRVEVGAGLVVVEAMKMENELRARRPGVVKRVYVRAGEAVEKGAPLVTLAAAEPSS